MIPFLPGFLTKNGYGNIVVRSIETYEKVVLKKI